MKYSSWKDAHLQAIGLQEAKYTNIHNKIKGIRNLSRKDADMIADIDPAVLGPVVKALAPMFEDVNEEVVSERVDFHGKSPAEKKGSEFDRKLEIKNIKNMIKGLEKLNKDHEKFQFNNRAQAGADVFKGLYAAERALYAYQRDVEKGEYDGKVDLED